MHGGANESSMRMLEEIESVDQVPAFLRQANAYLRQDPMAGFTQDIGARVTVTVARVAKTEAAK
jgi:hypothetical protein